MNHAAAPFPSPTWASRRQRGVTLVELLVSMIIMSILMGAMTSVIVLASRAIPTGTTPMEKHAAAMDVVDQMAGELFYATEFITLKKKDAKFTVADRGHGAAGPEEIRYKWGSNPKDPLTRRYNGGNVETVCDAAQEFSLTFTRCAIDLVGLPRVLLVVADAAAPSAENVARQSLMESWGFTVQLIAQSAAKGTYTAALPTIDVIYVSREVSTDISSLLKKLPKGIVCEDGTVRVGLGFGKTARWFSDSQINILSNAHEITAPFATGPLKIFNSSQDLMAVMSGLAGGAEVLADAPSLAYEALVTIEVDGALYGNGTAAGRRVALPWGNEGKSFDFQAVNADGKTIMRRAIVWAAASIRYAGVSITLQPYGSSEVIRTQTQLLNMPAVTSP